MILNNETLGFEPSNTNEGGGESPAVLLNKSEGVSHTIGVSPAIIEPITSEGLILVQDSHSQEPKTPALYNSIITATKETERFVFFLNDRFNLGLDLSDLVVLIHETRPTLKGYFRPKENPKNWATIKGETPLNSIVLSSHTLSDTPYETICHELAHYRNHKLGVQDCTKNQYHNKHFKNQAELMLLGVERHATRGYAYTYETPEFKQMLNLEFKPNPDAFKIFQNIQERKTKAKSRNLLFMCDCGFKIRSAKHNSETGQELNATCNICGSKFVETGGDNDNSY